MSTQDRFRKDTSAASKDQNLRAIMRKAVTHLAGMRSNALASMTDVEERRQRAADAKQYTLDNLPDLLELLEKRLTENGCVVHFAPDAKAARDIVADIATSRGVKTVVKGKSMISEEIELNEHLESLGIEAVETDLGEYIVQLAGQKPSHIVAPALHLNKTQVAQLFQEKLGRTSDTIPGLAQVARVTLREKFLAADMGVTGVNIAVAAAGALALVENEGNIRLSAACPRIHVAIMSLEKVVADWDAFADVMNVLPRFATGQHMPRSMSVYFGPRRPGEADGPDELHVVILDGGRSKLLADKAKRQVLRCIRCGACQNVCPVYATVGGHAYGYTYSGPIGELLAGTLLPPEESAHMAFACTMCGACQEVCPVKIEHPKVLSACRAQAADLGLAPMPKAAASAYRCMLEHPALYRAGAAAVRKLDPDLGKISSLPGLKGLRDYLGQRIGPTLQQPFAMPDPEEK